MHLLPISGSFKVVAYHVVYFVYLFYINAEGVKCSIFRLMCTSLLCFCQLSRLYVSWHQLCHALLYLQQMHLVLLIFSTVEDVQLPNRCMYSSFVCGVPSCQVQVFSMTVMQICIWKGHNVLFVIG